MSETMKPWRTPPTEEEWDNLWKSQADGFSETERPDGASNMQTLKTKTKKEKEDK